MIIVAVDVHVQFFHESSGPTIDVIDGIDQETCDRWLVFVVRLPLVGPVPSNDNDPVAMIKTA